MKILAFDFESNFRLCAPNKCIQPTPKSGAADVGR